MVIPKFISQRTCPHKYVTAMTYYRPFHHYHVISFGVGRLISGAVLGTVVMHGFHRVVKQRAQVEAQQESRHNFGSVYYMLSPA